MDSSYGCFYVFIVMFVVCMVMGLFFGIWCKYFKNKGFVVYYVQVGEFVGYCLIDVFIMGSFVFDDIVQVDDGIEFVFVDYYFGVSWQFKGVRYLSCMDIGFFCVVFDQGVVVVFVECMGNFGVLVGYYDIKGKFFCGG